MASTRSPCAIKGFCGVCGVVFLILCCLFVTSTEPVGRGVTLDKTQIQRQHLEVRRSTVAPSINKPPGQRPSRGGSPSAFGSFVTAVVLIGIVGLVVWLIWVGVPSL